MIVPQVKKIGPAGLVNVYDVIALLHLKILVRSCCPTYGYNSPCLELEPLIIVKL